jgi:uridine kinase
MEPYIIAVTGCSGSGKSTFTKQLIQKYNSHAVCLVEDRYCKDRSFIHPLDKRLNHNFDHPSAVDYDLMINNVRALKQGKTIQAPIYSYQTASRLNFTETIVAKPILFVEGLFVLLSAELKSLIDLSVYIDTNEATCIERRLQRDVQERQMPAWFTPSQLDYIRSGAYYVKQCKEYAHIIIDNNSNDRAIDLNLIVENIEKNVNFLQCQA